MPSTASFLMNAHDHDAALAPWSAAQISGFALVLLAAGLVAVAMERLRGAGGQRPCFAAAA
jgi:hypothetical protein